MSKTGFWNFPVSSATVELAAAALGCEPCGLPRLCRLTSAAERFWWLMAGNCKIDNAKYKQFFHVKAKMLSPDEALARTGHAVGGVCPFAIPENAKVYLDVSLKSFQTVFPACGSSNSAIEVTPDELERYAGPAGWIDVCKQVI